MEYIKSYWGEKGNYMVSVRTNCYNCSLAHVQKMVEVLRRDHPGQEIVNEAITIIIYNTPSYKGIMGVEYHTQFPNKTYFKLNEAPYKF